MSFLADSAIFVQRRNCTLCSLIHRVLIHSLLAEMQLKVIKIQNNAELYSVMHEKGLLEFYESLDRDRYPTVVPNARKLVSVFDSSYICEQAFSILNLNKSKQRSKLTDKHLHSLLSVGCPQFHPNIDQLAKKIKCNISH